MSSFFGRLKGTSNPSSNVAGNAPAKKDPHAPQPTPLEKLLADAGPLRTDGSDKFFGFENFGSTCYCNSIVQCLYYSAPFREQVINFPSRSPNSFLQRPQPERTSLNIEQAHHHGIGLALSPHKGKSLLGTSPTAAQKGKPTAPPGAQGQQGQRPEDNKDSPEYKKKMALAAGPVISMDYENSDAYSMTESLFTSLKDIFEAIIAHPSRIGVVSPHKFLEILRRENEMFRTPMHQDAHEFLNLLLNEVVENVEHFSKHMEDNFQRQERVSSDPESGLSDEMTPVMATIPEAAGKANNHSTRWVHELFEGTLTSETRCLTCENTSQRDEAFLDLSVDLEQHTSVTACLRKFSEEEMLCERNKFHCDKCGGLQEAEKRMKVKRLPRILALHLKRFKYTEDLQRLQKLFHRVVYPYYLRLFNTTDDAEDPDRLYELYAVVVHIGGGPYHGHYVSIIKTQDQGWLLFDDEMVEPVDKSYVRNFFGGESSLACAYVLFYQETTLEAMQAELDAESATANKAAEPVKETSPLAAKANGALNGINGILHHAYHPSTPLSEEHDHLANLEHAATAPAPAVTPISPIPFQTPLEQTPTSPTFQFLNRKKSDMLARRLHDREEKEREKQRKHDEKEAEKKKRKEEEQQRRDLEQKQEEELKAAIALSKATKADEDTRRTSFEPGPEKHKENGAFGLHRFARTSMSLRHKPKWIGSQRDKDRKAKEMRSHEHLVDNDTTAGSQPRPQHQPNVHNDVQPPGQLATPGEHPSSSASASTSAQATPERKKSHGQTKEKDKERFRFGLGRKKSSMGL